MADLLFVPLFGIGLLAAGFALMTAAAEWFERPRLDDDANAVQEQAILTKMGWRGAMVIGFAILLARSLLF